MATVTKSIGTTGRDYSTITLWEADLDNGTPYDAGDHAVGECYDDSAFDESVTINGGGTLGLASVTLSVAAGQRHDGTAGTGARIVRTAQSLSGVIAVSAASASIAYSVKWLEITQTHGVVTTGVNVSTSQSGTPLSVSNLLVHGMDSNSSGAAAIEGILLSFNNGAFHCHNCIVYGIEHTGSGNGGAAGIRAAGSGTLNAKNVLNCTIHRVEDSGGGSGSVFGVQVADSALRVYKNIVVSDVSTTGAGSAAGFSDSSITTATANNNASTDTTASGTGSLTEIASADQFVSTVEGSEDLHLKAGADCIDAGADLGTSPTGVNIDIDGRDRDAEADTWDIGADEFVAVGGDPAKAFFLRVN